MRETKDDVLGSDVSGWTFVLMILTFEPGALQHQVSVNQYGTARMSVASDIFGSLGDLTGHDPFEPNEKDLQQ